jgi:hypothetical protein
VRPVDPREHLLDRGALSLGREHRPRDPAEHSELRHGRLCRAEPQQHRREDGSDLLQGGSHRAAQGVMALLGGELVEPTTRALRERLHARDVAGRIRPRPRVHRAQRADHGSPDVQGRADVRADSELVHQELRELRIALRVLHHERGLVTDHELAERHVAIGRGDVREIRGQADLGSKILGAREHQRHERRGHLEGLGHLGDDALQLGVRRPTQRLAREHEEALVALFGQGVEAFHPTKDVLSGTGSARSVCEGSAPRVRHVLGELGSGDAFEQGGGHLGARDQQLDQLFGAARAP